MRTSFLNILVIATLIFCSCSKEITTEQKLAYQYYVDKYFVDGMDSTSKMSPSFVSFHFGTQFGQEKLSLACIVGNYGTVADDWYYLSSNNKKDYNIIMFHDIEPSYKIHPTDSINVGPFGFSYEYTPTITKLKGDDLWLKGDFNGSRYEYRMKKVK